MSYTDIRYENRGLVTWITINRPEVMNAVRPQTYADLTDAFRKADQDSETRVVVLTGEGRGFCSGDDVQEIFLAEDRDSQRSARKLRRYRSREEALTPIVPAILDCEKPTIAAVNGAAVGMGMDLALLCDIRIASDRAKFGSFFVRRGVVGSVGGTYFLRQIVGLSRAMEMLLSGELIDAAEADRIGLVSRVVPQDGLTDAVDELTEKLSWGAPLAQRTIKRVVRQGMTTDWQSLDEYAMPLADGLWESEDHLEGVRSYTEQRPPNFQAR
ncbi:MAG TPA: enoyl-CoA hydratase/isomerase family protein [Dehalococcoidia bacterium]|nr:enoyl-CoA hydratase/isomerase family protein [Dehalococcoidia bacterium]